MSMRLDAELRNVKRQRKSIIVDMPKSFVIAILTVICYMNITTISGLQEHAASWHSGSNIETNLRRRPEGLVQCKASSCEVEFDRILTWMIDMQKCIATHLHVEAREQEKRRKPRTRPKFRYEARVIGHRR